VDIYQVLHKSVTYDHRIFGAALPVRSAVLKKDTGGLVVKWVTIGESPLLYVFVSFCFDVQFGAIPNVAQVLLFLLLSTQVDALQTNQNLLHLSLPTSISTKDAAALWTLRLRVWNCVYTQRVDF
jgi:hypothetical protein